MKKLLALLLCLSITLTLIPPVFATETDPATTTPEEATVAPTQSATEPTETTPADEEPTQGSTEEPTQIPTDAGEEDEDGIALLNDVEVTVGDTVYIKPGHKVYKSMDENAEGYSTKFSHKIEVEAVEQIGDTIWIKFDDWDLNFLGYRYVKKTSTSSTDQAVNDCDCGSTDPNVANHPDECTRKQYIETIVADKTADEIYQNWDNFDAQTRQDVLDVLKKTETETYYDLLEKAEGRAAVVLDKLGDLEGALADLSDEGCDEFYGKMMDAYALSFDNDVTIVSGEEMKKIDDAFGEMENYLLEQFGYSEILPSVMPITEVPTSSESSHSVEDSLVLDKYVSTNGKTSDFLLTLESYVTGSTQNYVQPVDLVLVLDQSASMYAPMGTTGSNNQTLYTASSQNILRYEFKNNSTDDETSVTGVLDLSEQLEDEKFVENIQQLGYLVAQSRVKSHEYKGTKWNDDTYDWFVVQYVPDDADGKVWHMYRIPVTACPSNDWKNDQTWNTKKLTFTQEDIGKEHFYFYKSQTGALLDGVNALASKLKESGVNHRLAIAGFSGYDVVGDGSPEKNEKKPGTCIYVDGSKIAYNNKYNLAEKQNTTTNRYNSCTITDDEYKSALMSVQNNYAGIQKSLKAITTDYYGTYQDVGLDMALNILKNATEVKGDIENVGRRQVVVLFTDGAPSGPKKGDIVAKAKELKDEGIEIYTICTSTLAEADRAFLSASSSDYPNAIGTPDTDAADNFNAGEAITSPKYAKTAENTTDLVKDFLSIVEDVSLSYIDLDEKAVLQDALADDFVLPKELVDALKKASKDEKEVSQDEIKQYIKVYTANYDGKEFGDKEEFKEAMIEIQKDGDTEYSIIKVTNFDYSENFVSKTPRKDKENNNFYGKMLIVEIPVNVASDSLGGNHLPTNIQEDSAVYRPKGESGELEKLKEFPVPYVDLPTTVTVTKNVVGVKADENKVFSFSYTGVEISDYEKDFNDEHYLKAKTGESRENFTLMHAGVLEIKKLYVGSKLTIAETVDKYYEAGIQIFDKDGKDITPTVNPDGSVTVTVTPGMKIVYTNTCLLADLTIEKKGLEDVDENQSTLFKVTGDGNFEIEIVIKGNNSVTIENILAGTYQVEELTDWSWRYQTVDDQNTKQITVECGKDNKVTFTNKRTNEYWLSGDAYCKNLWDIEAATN